MPTPEPTFKWARIFRLYTDLIDAVLRLIQNGIVKFFDSHPGAFEVDDELTTSTVAAMLAVCVRELDARGWIVLVQGTEMGHLKGRKRSGVMFFVFVVLVGGSTQEEVSFRAPQRGRSSGHHRYHRGTCSLCPRRWGR